MAKKIDSPKKSTEKQISFISLKKVDLTKRLSTALENEDYTPSGERIHRLTSHAAVGIIDTTFLNYFQFNFSFVSLTKPTGNGQDYSDDSLFKNLYPKHSFW